MFKVRQSPIHLLGVLGRNPNAEHPDSVTDVLMHVERGKGHGKRKRGGKQVRE
jgi:hypothetical protein